MLLDRAVGFAKEAASGSFLKSIGEAAVKLVKKPAVWKAGLGVGSGVALGAYAHSQLQKQPPLEPGALTREKRRTEIAQYGSM